MERSRTRRGEDGKTLQHLPAAGLDALACYKRHLPDLRSQPTSVEQEAGGISRKSSPDTPQGLPVNIIICANNVPSMTQA